MDYENPTKVTSSVTYVYSPANITLTSTATLAVEYSTPIKARYDYSRQYLNKIGASTPYGTKSGTIFVKSNSVGELAADGTVDWNTGSEGTIALKAIKMDPSYFSEYTASTTFVGTLKDASVNAFFNSTDSGLSSVTVTMYVNTDTSLRKMIINAKSEKGADVDMNFAYSYDVVTVTIPD